MSDTLGQAHRAVNPSTDVGRWQANLLLRTQRDVGANNWRTIGVRLDFNWLSREHALC